MDEPPSHSLQILLSGPGLYALGFTFFVLFLSSIALAVVEVIFLKYKDAYQDKTDNTTIWNLKHVHDQFRPSLITWKVLDIVSNITMMLTLILFFSLFFSPTLVEVLVGCVVVWILGVEIIGKFLLKGWTLKYPAFYVKILSGILRSAVVLCKPITDPLLRIDSLITRRINRTERLREEINDALARTIKDEDGSEGQKEILNGIVTFSTLQVSEVMRGRADIAALNIGLNFHELLQKISVYGFSRVPVFRNLTDQLEGVLYSKDLLPFLDRDASFEWQKLLRPGFFVNENKRLDSLLKEFQEKRIHIALVLNEQKRVSGIITMEDVIEEIIGDINDVSGKDKLNK